LNAGQTCIAPDYLLVHESIKKEFTSLLIQEIHQFYGENIKASADYPRIIRKEHLKTLTDLLQGEHIIEGGNSDEDNLYLAPTLVDNPDRESDVMQQEIFGPILPIISYKTRQDLEKWIDSYDQPLGAYVFSGDSDFKNWFINRFSFGGGAVNDAIVQFINDRLPFGGVGTSGIGSYHGKKSFETFSHFKSVVHRGTWLDIPIKYPPYTFSIVTLKKAFKWL